jgi:hypothetical protein
MVGKRRGQAIPVCDARSMDIGWKHEHPMEKEQVQGEGASAW